MILSFPLVEGKDALAHILATNLLSVGFSALRQLWVRLVFSRAFSRNFQSYFRHVISFVVLPPNDRNKARGHWAPL